MTSPSIPQFLQGVSADQLMHRLELMERNNRHTLGLGTGKRMRFLEIDNGLLKENEHVVATLKENVKSGKFLEAFKLLHDQIKQGSVIFEEYSQPNGAEAQISALVPSGIAPRVRHG